jgi:uncharacterized protein (TIGR04255 family)
MLTYPKLNKAPIKEAIISLTIDNNKHTIEALENICNNLITLYPKKEELKEDKIELNFNNNILQTHTQSRHIGFILTSNDNNKIITITQDRISFNVLSAYQTWEIFLDEYKLLWDKFTCDIKTPYNIKDIKLLYINEFDIPILNWHEYILMQSNMAVNTDCENSTIETIQTTSHHKVLSREYEAISDVIIQITPKDTEFLNVIFSIDITSEHIIDNYKNFAPLNPVFNQLRQLKNKIFFANVPQAQELFQ